MTLAIATAMSGLLAGLFYAWSCSVMPGLGRCADRVFVEAMQRINAAILNPAFLVVFLGAPLLTGTALVLDPGLAVAAAFALHAVTLGVTAFVNVPLNDRLAATPTGAVSEGSASATPPRSERLAASRAAYEPRWVVANHARTLTATCAFACLVVALGGWC